MAQQTSIIGRRLGNYYIVGELGKGGMGVVFKAKDLALERTVAIKFLPDHFASDPDAVKRFVREARSAARLNHPNIVTVYQVGKLEESYFIAMEFVEGQSLDELIKRRNLDVYASAELMLQVVEALAEAHGQGIVHRDIKPQNIMITRSGRAKVMDFGLARSSFENTRLTATGQTMGTPQFMSPEQWQDSHVDGRADIFSLGVTFYVMVTGTPAFDGTTPAAVMKKVLMEEPPPPSSVNEAVTPQLADIIEKMMAKRPEDRFQNAQDLVAALREFLSTRQPRSNSSAAEFSPPGADLTLEKLSRNDSQFRGAAALTPSAVPTTPMPREEVAPSTPARSSRTAALGVGALSICLLAAFVGWRVFGSGDSIGGVIPRGDFVWVEPGTFEMGSLPEEPGRNADESLHQVTLTKGFFISKYEVTQGQWKEVMGSNPSLFTGDDRPVENVSWHDAQEFIRRLNDRGANVRLPTEAEWEYAARAGSRAAYHFGSTANLLGDYAWYAANSGGETHPVGSKRANAWGLYDMSGNVWEWCQDWAAVYPVGNVVDPTGPPSGSDKIGRGGSWGVDPTMCRSADRNAAAPDVRGNDLGFRLVYE